VAARAADGDGVSQALGDGGAAGGAVEREDAAVERAERIARLATSWLAPVAVRSPTA